jgi:hypothetical protein
VNEAESKEILAEWFRLVQEWQVAERELSQAEVDAAAGHPDGEANIAKARHCLQKLKTQMNDVIASGKEARNTEAKDFVAGTIKFGRMN